MTSRQKPQQSLRHRVEEFLHRDPLPHRIEEPKEESLEQIFALIQRAEKELEVAKQRVDRLKWELKRARS